MCRVFMANKKGFERLHKEFNAVKFFDQLEKSFGGHGNGYFLVKDSEIILMDKGLKLDNASIVAEMSSADFDWCFYHTRLASISGQSDSNCHPYVDFENNFGLIMNGTESEIGKMAKTIDITDTELIFRILRDNPEMPIDSVNNYTSRFMGYRDGKAWFSNNGSVSPLQKALYKDDEIVIASEFNSSIPHQTVASKQVWEEGNEIKLMPKPSKKGVKPLGKSNSQKSTKTQYATKQAGTSKSKVESSYTYHYQNYPYTNWYDETDEGYFEEFYGYPMTKEQKEVCNLYDIDESEAVEIFSDGLCVECSEECDKCPIFWSNSGGTNALDYWKDDKKIERANSSKKAN